MKDETFSEDSGKISYRMLKFNLYDEDISFNSHYRLIYGWQYNNNRKQAFVTNRQHKINQYPEK